MIDINDLEMQVNVAIRRIWQKLDALDQMLREVLARRVESPGECELRTCVTQLNEQMLALGDRFNAIEARLGALEYAACACEGTMTRYCKLHRKDEE